MLLNSSISTTFATIYKCVLWWEKHRYQTKYYTLCHHCICYYRPMNQYMISLGMSVPCFILAVPEASRLSACHIVLVAANHWPSSQIRGSISWIQLWTQHYWFTKENQCTSGKTFNIMRIYRKHCGFYP